MSSWLKTHIPTLLIIGMMVLGPGGTLYLTGQLLNVSQAQSASLGCVTPDLNFWRSYSFMPQTGTFTVAADVTPRSSATDALLGLSAADAGAYTDLAAIVRFSSVKGAIDARNGSVYSAGKTIPYTAGKTYHVRMAVNIPAHTYSAYVTPSGGTEITIGTNFAFRTEQAKISAIGYWTPVSDVATFQVCNWTMSGGTVPAVDTQAPSVPQGVTAAPVSSSAIKISWQGSSDNIGVAGYNVYQDDKLVVSTDRLYGSYTITGLVPPTIHDYTVSAYDAAGNTSAKSVSVIGSIGTISQVITPLVAPAPAPVGPATYDSAVLADHPVAFWDLNPMSGTESDLSGNGHVGTYKSGLPGTATLPNGDKAADFNGSDQYLTVPSSKSFSVPTTGNLTWEAWVRPDVLQFPKSDVWGGYVDFMGKCDQYSPTCEWESRMYNVTTPQGRSSRISAYVFNNSAGLGSAADWQPVSNLIGANQWIHVVGEYTTKSSPSDCPNAVSYPGSINIWVNGVLWNQSYHGSTGCMSQYGVTPKANSSALNIGTMALDSWFKGAIGKVAIYNYLLTQTQISDHYKTMTGLTPSGSCADMCSF